MALNVPMPVPNPVTIAGPVTVIRVWFSPTANDVIFPLTYIVVPSGVTAKHSKYPDTLDLESFVALSLRYREHKSDLLFGFIQTTAMGKR